MVSPQKDRFHREDARLETFDIWPVDCISRNALAMTGTFYTGEADIVKCYFCKVEIYSWKQTDDPISEHLRLSINCPLLRRCTTNNVPINSIELNQMLSTMGCDTCGMHDFNIKRRVTSSKRKLCCPPFVIMILTLFILRHTINKA
ncbi:death-associated inhibitor of apoptosis 1-like [Haematobia irritans]|uniref:death-associated inhibitor of apoptosis 1-like n=1 Tax=Haematobia irritans TaxID=7368 RepID=UPI003F4F82C6